MAKTPQISNAETYARLGTTPLGMRPGDLARDLDRDVLPSDLRDDTIRIAGQRFVISGSGRIRMA